VDKSYLTSIEEFTDRSEFGPDLATRLESLRPGHLMRLAASVSAEVDVRLGKRYARPIPNPPEIVKTWCAALMTPRAFRALGTNPSDAQQQDITAAQVTALQELKEAADAANGLFDLPLSAADSKSGIKEPATLACSEQSPYTWRHKQGDAVRGNRRYG
jgi:phage gp36-like protein